MPLTFLCALTFAEIVNQSGSTVIRTALVLLAGTGLLYQLGALEKVATAYADLTPLALPGASFVRLPADEATEYQQLAQRMKHFDAFVSQPDLMSLYLWTESTPPTKWNAGAWVRLISPQRQEEIVAALRGAKRPGAAVHPRHAAFWTEGQQDVSSPLAAYIEGSCARVDDAGQWGSARLHQRLNSDTTARVPRAREPIMLEPRCPHRGARHGARRNTR